MDVTKRMVERVDSGKETNSKRGEGLRRKSFGLIAEKVRALQDEFACKQPDNQSLVVKIP